MASVTKEYLSGSTDGAPVAIAATSTPGTTIHTAHATLEDEVWIWAWNKSASAIKLTVEWGSDTTYHVEQMIDGESGAVLVIPGWILTNSKTVKAFAGTTNEIAVAGYVNRITN
jgi:hypothetical protein